MIGAPKWKAPRKYCNAKFGKRKEKQRRLFRRKKEKKMPCGLHHVGETSEERANAVFTLVFNCVAYLLLFVDLVINIVLLFFSEKKMKYRHWPRKKPDEPRNRETAEGVKVLFVDTIKVFVEYKVILEIADFVMAYCPDDENVYWVYFAFLLLALDIVRFLIHLLFLSPWSCEKQIEDWFANE